jgi:anti-sigma-K factor RskA
MSQESKERLLDLLEKRAFYGLTSEEHSELQQLSGDDDISLDLTASAIALSELREIEPLPAHLRAKIESQADDFFAKRPAGKKRVGEVRPTGLGTGFWSWFGWTIAAAACIALAANVYLTRINPIQVARPGPTPAPPSSLAPLTPEQMRQQLSTLPDVARADIGPGKEQYRPTGQIVWSDARQAGYVDIKGLPKNDPSKEQYQLWIFDQNQDPKTPIDGGVFDVNSDGEVVIPIDAKIKVKGPKVFAITVERPGGVVVSKQEKVAALAKVET